MFLKLLTPLHFWITLYNGWEWCCSQQMILGKEVSVLPVEAIDV